MSERVFRRDPAGFTIVTPVGAIAPTPLCCPVCQTALRSRDDERAYDAYGCCYACEIEWVHVDVARWREGLRPSQVIIDTALAARPGIAVHIERG